MGKILTKTSSLIGKQSTTTEIVKKDNILSSTTMVSSALDFSVIKNPIDTSTIKINGGFEKIDDKTEIIASSLAEDFKGSDKEIITESIPKSDAGEVDQEVSKIIEYIKNNIVLDTDEKRQIFLNRIKLEIPEANLKVFLSKSMNDANIEKYRKLLDPTFLNYSVTPFTVSSYEQKYKFDLSIFLLYLEVISLDEILNNNISIEELEKLAAFVLNLDVTQFSGSLDFTGKDLDYYYLTANIPVIYIGKSNAISYKDENNIKEEISKIDGQETLRSDIQSCLNSMSSNIALETTKFWKLLIRINDKQSYAEELNLIPILGVILNYNTVAVTKYLSKNIPNDYTSNYFKILSYAKTHSTEISALCTNLKSFLENILKRTINY